MGDGPATALPLFETPAKAGVSPAAPFTERELFDRLRARYAGRAGNGPRWAFAAHVRDRAGWDATRTLDAVAMDTWQSHGLLLHGFEIKCSRGDWRRELADPSKAAAFTRYMDRFWIVAPRGIVKVEELPERWGLLETRGAGLAAVVQAAQLDPEPVDRSFLACLMRAACHRTPDPEPPKPLPASSSPLV